MINYQYSGINKQGKRVNGELQAENERDLEKRLAESGIEVINFKEKTALFSFSFGKPKVTKRDIITVTAQIRQLLKAGITLMDLLDDLRTTYESESVRAILANVYESMEGGDTLSDALKPYEEVFGTVYISLISVGERTGQLEGVLLNLEEMLKWEESLISKAKKVMIYPAIVATVILAVITLLMVFVVPELLSFISEMGGEIGFATMSLIAVSNFVQEYFWAIIATPIIVIFLFKLSLKKIYRFRLWYDKNIFNIKLFGPIMFQLKIARFSNSLSVMYGAGLGFIESLRLASSVLSNTYIENNVQEAIRLIEEGAPINEAFKEAEVMPLMAARMVKVGELSGNMDDALMQVSEYYDTQAKETIDKIEPTIEPLLTVVMAVVVGWVMIAVLGPVYDTISQVQ